MSTGTDQRGSALVQSIFAIAFLMMLVLGVIQVAFSLYARNAIASAVHEGARRGLEFGATPAAARLVAVRTVRDSVGRLVDDLAVASGMQEVGGHSLVYVRVTGVLRPLGPVPLPMSVDLRASASREVRP